MDDFERAILYSFDETGSVDPVYKSQAIAYCNQLKETPSICRICIDRLSSTKFVQVQFWCLQTTHEVLRTRYSSISPDEKSYIKDAILSVACHDTPGDRNSIRVLDGPPFIKNKLAQVFVTIIYFEYPSSWPSVFLDILRHLARGAPVIDMFCRVLNDLDDELISTDYPRNAEEALAATRIKEAMKQQCISQIARTWYDIVVLYRNSNPELATSVLDTMRRYVTWINIGLIANDSFVPLLFDIILTNEQTEELRSAASTCVLAIISKRMDPQSKLSLLRSLQINRTFGLLASSGNSEFISKLADLLTGYATEALDCSKRLDLDDAKGICMDLLDEVLPSVFYVLRNCELDATFNMIQFLSGYINTMKTFLPLKEKQAVYVNQLLDIIRVQISYDPVYRENLDLPDKVGKEEEDRMTEYRKDMLVLLRNVGRIAPDVTLIFLRNSMSNALVTSETNVEDVEVTLSLFYALGETLTEDGFRNSSTLWKELISLVLSTRFSCHSHRLVALVYLETITRYVKFIQEDNQTIPHVLSAFLDERGIHHSNSCVSRRASYLFMRVVKMMKSKLIPFIETILQSLQDTLAQFICTDWETKGKLSNSEDGSHIFEAIGLLIGVEGVPAEKQSEYLSILLTPLCQQVESLLLDAKGWTSEESSNKIIRIQQVITAINSLSKGFNERLVASRCSSIGIMFKKTLDVLLQIFVAFPKVEALRSKVTSFLHRMIEILGPSVFPYLPKTLEQLLAETEPKELVNFLVLINQLICKFDKSVGDIVEELFPMIANRVFHILPSDDFLSGPVVNTEEVRELQELQKLLYTFLHVMATHDLSWIFLTSKSRRYLDRIMHLLLYTSCHHKDVLTRKTCVQIFIRLIKDWCAHLNGDEKVPGFQSFVIETFAINCCLYSVLDKTFEFRDANTLILFGEIVTAQKVMYEKFGNDFLLHFVSKGFEPARCPQDLVKQYCEELQKSNIQSLVSVYQTLIETLRCQPNGNLVFR